MWYAIDMDDGILARAGTKKEILTKISDMDTRCRRFMKGVYIYEQKDECERSCWHEIAYIFSSKKAACENGFGWAFENENQS